ncbi:heterokaryon incompatibility protein-domain-containing protein [Paraphoma chrysanthemicola]|uniref:Heterokaryon incompatibility protein-domain-containing protein n=1 Tax=Paraphoma chrysanthemicola TaxID=798071 RepID=A0A8K0R5P7_9PLEO|nr:heterokaryon incompatibility protein-domain-containing protein [Paraphoma chrysanthemicola]
MNWHDLPSANSLEHDVPYNALRLSRKETLQLGTIKELDRSGPVHLWSLWHYQYSALPNNSRFVRVLCLERPRHVAGWRKALIPCASVIYLPLPTENTISALSYVWGKPEKTHPIILDGCVFWVTENLFAALERLQEQDRILLLWVDAVCINQADLKEKSAQVQQMGKIYRMAKLVLGWIGPATDGSEVAMKALAYIGKACDDMPDGPCLEERRQLFEEVLPEDSSSPGKAFPTAQVMAIFNRPWWTRIWIVQEVNLAENTYVICGSSSITYRHIRLAFTALMELPMINARFNNVLHSRIKGIAIQSCKPRLIESSMDGIASDPIPLATRLIRATGFGATKPVDHIFALIGLTSDMKELGIVADYNKTCSQVYTKVAAALLHRQGNLQILARSRNPKLESGLPSWVPDWSQPPPIMIWTPQFPVYSAGKCSLKQKIRVTGNKLTIRGIIAGRVEKVGCSWDFLSAVDVKDGPKTMQGILNNVRDFVDAHCFAYTTPEEKEDAMWRAPIVDTEFGVFGENGRYNRRATEPMHRAFRSLRQPSELSDPSLEEFKHRYFTAAPILRNRQFFATSNGYLGNGPSDMRTGDLVCVLINGDVPFVVRQVEDQSGPKWLRKWQNMEYHLIGECYVHKMMDGEIWTEQTRVEDLVLV